MPFSIEYFTTGSDRSVVETFILSQNKKTASKIFSTILYFEKFGFQLPTNYLRRMSGTKRLWELRIKHSSNQYRIFLAKSKARNNTVILLHAFIKKTGKTPNKEIQTAEDRLKLFDLSE